MPKLKPPAPSGPLESFHKIFNGGTKAYAPLLCNSEEKAKLQKQRQRSLRQEFGKSRSGVWGPTHSEDSEDEIQNTNKTASSAAENNKKVVGGVQNGSGEGTHTTHTNTNSGDEQSLDFLSTKARCKGDTDKFTFTGGCAAIDEVWNSASEWILTEACAPCRPDQTSYTEISSKGEHQKSLSARNFDITVDKNSISSGSSLTSFNNKANGKLGTKSKNKSKIATTTTTTNLKECNDENARAAAKAMAETTAKEKKHHHSSASSKLKKSILRVTTSGTTPSKSVKTTKTPTNTPKTQPITPFETPHSTSSDRNKIPFDFVILSQEQQVTFERQISELTMQSCYSEAQVNENRRMAYYALGKDTPRSGTGGSSQGGNRRCYFSGNLIKRGRPFYAGNVQQGMRTLVVFCLPSTLDLPKESALDGLIQSSCIRLMETSPRKKSCLKALLPDHASTRHDLIKKKSSLSAITRASHTQTHVSMHTATSNVDEVDVLLAQGLIQSEELLDLLPHPSKELLDEMERRFPKAYSTLPNQVRSPKCWRMYHKFCFFSGLPIADGEMYYKVIDKISEKLMQYYAKKNNNNNNHNSSASNKKSSSSRPSVSNSIMSATGIYSSTERDELEEIILSHEVMVAVNGESAEILRLPNKKTFKYLQRHYQQQCAKLSAKVFERTSWEMVMPEV